MLLTWPAKKQHVTSIGLSEAVRRLGWVRCRMHFLVPLWTKGSVRRFQGPVGPRGNPDQKSLLVWYPCCCCLNDITWALSFPYAVK